MTDVIYIKEALQGSRRAEQELVQANYQTVFAYVYRMTGDWHLASDLTQDVFIKALAALGSYREQGSFTSWLLTIASNCFRDHWRRQKRRQTVPLSEADCPTGDCVDEVLEQQDRELRIKRALAQISLVQREVIVLRYYHELKLEEISLLSGVNLSTVKSRLRQGLLKLKEITGGENYGQKSSK